MAVKGMLAKDLQLVGMSIRGDLPHLIMSTFNNATKQVEKR
jgi:hypothetical protein